jgi:23S rRNA (cytidine1920-2'-O)/16S rRNA (cytidine1409-2'-O)-methyltransferase
VKAKQWTGNNYMVERVRVDRLLVERDLVESREQAQRLVLAGHVEVEGKRIDKPGARILPTAQVKVSVQDQKYVSRGGQKLEAALEQFGLQVAGNVAADIGASTGGFTDCLLQRGAARVYAIDVGYGQLHWRLRRNPRVVCMERCNARYLTRDSLPEQVDVVTIDVSFISVGKIFPAVWQLCREGAMVLCLVKPQFEAGRREVPKGGVVKDPSVHRTVLKRVVAAARESGFQVKGAMASPILGVEGNREYFLVLRRGAREREQEMANINLDEIVDDAFRMYDHNVR